MIGSAKTNATKPSKAIPRFPSTSASETLPMEHTKLTIATAVRSAGLRARLRAGGRRGRSAARSCRASTP